MSEAPAARNRWGTLAQALALAKTEEALVRAGRNRDIQAQITHHFRPPVLLPPEYWNGELDYERSRIRPCVNVEYDSKGRQHMSIPGWVIVRVDLDSVRGHFGSQTKPPKNKGGRDPTYDWERAGLEILGKIYRGETPEPKPPAAQAKVERLYEDWFGARHEHPSKSLVRDHARELLKQLRDEGEAEN
jgi:hypothetical protein